MSYEPLPLPEGVTDDYVDCTSSCGLKFHVLKAGEVGKPLILFCHGYPELAFSWRKILPAVAKAGYYCVAMDQRGYGRTTGWEDKPYHEVDLTQYVFTNLVRDLVCLTYGLGYTEVACMGHSRLYMASLLNMMSRRHWSRLRCCILCNGCIDASRYLQGNHSNEPSTPRTADSAARRQAEAACC